MLFSMIPELLRRTKMFCFFGHNVVPIVSSVLPYSFYMQIIETHRNSKTKTKMETIIFLLSYI